MLGPSHKSLGGEDSSGSDAGSEVGLEPETDRFGFIVTNGSTARSVGPPPELVRQREAKWINILDQWERILLKKTSKVKVQCQKGIPSSLRSRCWPRLCGATDRMNQNKDLYTVLDSQSALQSWVDIIERDLDRQFPFHEMFLSKDGHGQRGLFRVLKAYTQYRPEEGYCQAQGPVAAVLLMNMPAEEAFWCLVQISEQYLPGYYSPLLEGVLFDAAMLTWVLKRTCPAAHKHLQHHCVEPLMFATDWLMCLFTRHLPFNTLLRVWDLFFCYGVRVLLQVAVVLVRRVLGRAEQRKQCPGQMETLERLRGVREQVQDDDDAFIAEVCSVPLSARDLEKQTEKELEKWRKDRPSSTFDPRGRCLGYRMVWARARQTVDERERKEREKGNLTVPLTRSASTLSLSPSVLRKRFGRGGKANAGEWEGGGGGKVVRHLSMGAKEDCTGWTELNFKTVQGVQEEEDIVLEEHKKETELQQTGQSEQKELLEEPKNMPTVEVEETVIAKEQNEQVETIMTEKEESQLKQAEETTLPEQTEETNVETEPTQGPAKDQTVENTLQQGDGPVQSRDLDQQSHKSKEQEIEVQDVNKETETEEVESEHAAAVEEDQTEIQEDADADTNAEVETDESAHPSEEQVIRVDVKPEESTETEQVPPTQVGAATEASETASDTDGEVEAPTGSDPEGETETQGQEQQVEITEAASCSQGDAVEGKYHSTESLAKTDTKERSHTQTETDALAQAQEKEEGDPEAEIASEQHTDSEAEAETVIQCLPECSQSEEGTDPEAEAETEAEIPVSNDPVTEQREEFAQCSEEECDAGASEPTQEKEEVVLTACSEVDGDRTQAEETPAESHRDDEAADSTAPPQQEVTSAQPEEVNLIAEPDEKTSSAETSTTEPDEKTSSAETSTTEPDGKRSSEETSTTEPDGKTSSAETSTAEPDGKRSSAETSTAEPDGKTSSAETSTTEPDEKMSSVQTSTAEPDGKTSSVETSTAEPDGKTSSVETSTAEPDGKRSSVETSPAEPDEKMSPVETSATEPEPEPALQQPIQAAMVAVEEEEGKENAQENAVGEDDVFVSTEPTDSIAESNPEVRGKESNLVKDQAELSTGGLTQAPGRRGSRSSGDFCVRKSSNSRGSRLGRRLSEDLFTVPQKTSQSEPVPAQPEVKHTETQSGDVKPTQNPPDVTPSSEVASSPSEDATERTEVQQEAPDPRKRFGLFRRLRGEQPKKAKGTPKMQVPKILIQDFSDETGTEKKPFEEEGEEKLSSRERRRRRRERERKEKEEERSRKKREKELEKERERGRRKPQTRGKSFQTQREKGSSDEPQPAKTGSQTLRYSASYAESYF